MWNPSQRIALGQVLKIGGFFDELLYTCLSTLSGCSEFGLGRPVMKAVFSLDDIYAKSQSPLTN